MVVRLHAEMDDGIEPMETAANDRRIARQYGTGRQLMLGPNRLTWKAVGAETDGRFALMEFEIVVGSGAGLHVHHHEDESMYILAGILTVYLDDQLVQAAPGAFVLIPRGVRHAFVNRGEELVRVLITLTPAGLEGFFEAVAGPDAPQTDAAFDALAKRYQLEFLGPIPAEP